MVNIAHHFDLYERFRTDAVLIIRNHHVRNHHQVVNLGRPLARWCDQGISVGALVLEPEDWLCGALRIEDEDE